MITNIHSENLHNKKNYSKHKQMYYEENMPNIQLKQIGIKTEN